MYWQSFSSLLSGRIEGCQTCVLQEKAESFNKSFKLLTEQDRFRENILPNPVKFYINLNCEIGDTCIGLWVFYWTWNPAQGLSTVNCQLSTVNCQLSTVNCQLSTLNCQLSTVNCQLSTVNCQLSTLNCQLSTVNSQLSTLNYQRSTVNCQLSTGGRESWI